MEAWPPAATKRPIIIAVTEKFYPTLIYFRSNLGNQIVPLFGQYSPAKL
jgi:hypothetical protein